MEGQEIDVLRAKLSATICSVLTERISILKQFGLSCLWLNADSNDEFNAGTILGYIATMIGYRLKSILVYGLLTEVSEKKIFGLKS
jgi:hypothetical protein